MPDDREGKRSRSITLDHGLRGRIVVPRALLTFDPGIRRRMFFSRVAFALRHRLRVLRAVVHHQMVRLRDRDPLIPPSALHSVGLGDFKRVGENLFRLMIELGALRPEERVLDIGCGTGRLARPLAGYLDRGSFDGLDIVYWSIAWCRQAYQNVPNFRFHHADLINSAYNPSGAIAASEYRFPFAADRFDFVLLTSVFTHMLRADTEHYLEETARVLAPGGRVFMSAYLLDDASRAAIRGGGTSLTFRYELRGCYAEARGTPEEAVAYDRSAFTEMVVAAGLKVDKFVAGSWRGHPGVAHQDILVLTGA